MANLCALKPPVDGAEQKMARAGTIMLRRGDALGVVRKLIFYTERNIDTACDEGRQADVEVQFVRLRTLKAVRDGLMCLPEFSNPADAPAMEARRAATTEIDAVRDSAVPKAGAQGAAIAQTQ